MGKEAAKCTFTKDCKNPPKAGQTYCAQHEKAALQAQKDAVKAKAEAAKKEEEKKALEAKKAEQALAAKKRDEEEAAKKKKIQEIATDWRAEVKAVADQVKNLRRTNPNANAGTNSNGTTKGGTNNPIELKLPSDAKNIAKKDVFDVLKPDGSDSGIMKFRVGDILIHVR